MPIALSPPDAGRIATRARKLLRRGQITHRQHAILDCLLWSCRAPGRASCRVSYTRLCRLAHVSRETIAGAIRRLARLGLIRKIRHRITVVWVNGGRATRQAVNEYQLLPHTEFGQATVHRELEIPEITPAAVRTAQEALKAIRDARQALLFNNPAVLARAR